MPYGDDISDGLPITLSNPAGSTTYTATGYAYDIAIAGLPFFISPLDDSPYRRVTAQYRKQQIDQSREPGEQTLTGWWLRSQSSFHYGQGIKFFEPIQDESLRFQYTVSKGIDVWTPGQCTLLKESTKISAIPSPIQTNGRSAQNFGTIEWTAGGTEYNGILFSDSYVLVKIDQDGNRTLFQAYDPATQDKIYAVTNDGTYAYWITNTVSGTNKLHMYKKALDADYTTAATLMFNEAGIVVANAVLEFTKERIVACINEKIYELNFGSTALGTPVYTHPATDHIWSGVASSGAAIYVAGWNGIKSTIVKFTLETTGAMPTLTSAITAAELPIGEVVHRIEYYLGFLCIGTNKGVRIANVSDNDGSIVYGPLIVETTQPAYDFAFRDKFVWCATSLQDGTSGIIRINLGQQLSELVFPYSNDLFSDDLPDAPTTAVAFLGTTERLAWCTAATKTNTITYKQLTSNVATLTTGTPHTFSVGDVVFVAGVGSPFNSSLAIGGSKTITAVPSDTTFSYAAVGADVALTAVSPAGQVNLGGSGYLESATSLVSEGSLRTGFVRYNTLEGKIFKLINARINTAHGAFDMQSVTAEGGTYDIGTFAQGQTVPEVNVSYPVGSQEYLGFIFTMYRDENDATQGPLFTGYQIKALPAIPRQRLIQYPVMCYDHEMDKFNNEVGYEGSAYARMSQLESVENVGDTIRIEDFRTGENYIGLIEEMDFINRTPTDKRFSGYGGLLLVTIRSV